MLRHPAGMHIQTPIHQTITDFTTYANVLVQDKALMAQFRAQNPVLSDLLRTILDDGEQSEPILPIPRITDMTALQCSVFDNWPTGAKAKNRPIRYNLAITAWDTEPRLLNFKRSKPCFRGNALLHTPKELIKTANRIRKPNLKRPISDDYHYALTQMFATMFPDHLIGPILTKGRGSHGTVYHEAQVAVVKMENGKMVSCDIYLGTYNEMLELPAFSPTNSKKDPLPRKVMCQSRWSLDARLAKEWGT